MKKKIGCVIVCRKGHNNYGTSLQGYAMIMKLRQMGYDPEVINYIKRLSLFEKIKWVINFYRCGGGSLLKKSKKEVSKEYSDNINLRTAAVEAYKDEKIRPYFKDYIGYKDLHTGSKNYDVVIVGSDQVWLPVSLPSKFFNLLFVDDSVKKISYASSFGVQDIPDFQKKNTGKYLDRFYRVGVREERGKEIVDSLSKNKATVVADPTMLLTRNEWEDEIASSIINDQEPYIFCYLISENEEARVKATELAKVKGLKIICIRHLEKYRPVDDTYGDEAPYNVGPNEFVKYIKNAEYVVTDSFHCTVFSHIFHKSFLTFYRSISGKNAKNSRIDSLFYILGTNLNRLYSIGGLKGIDSEVDWDKVDRNLENLRKNSISFLKEALD